MVGHRRLTLPMPASRIASRQRILIDMRMIPMRMASTAHEDPARAALAVPV